jgi:hypothetical protein
MPTAPNKPPRLTPLEALIKTSVGSVMRHRLRVARSGKRHYGMKVEETAVLLHVRFAGLEGRLLSATALAEEAMVNRRTAGRALEKVRDLAIVTWEERGKEVLYDNPPDFFALTNPVIEDYIELMADQIATGDRLREMVAVLKDEALKARITKAVHAVKMSAFRLT